MIWFGDDFSDYQVFSLILFPTEDPTATAIAQATLDAQATLNAPTDEAVVTPMLSDETCRVVVNAAVNFRTGPSTNYPSMGALDAGMVAPIVGRVSDNSWMQIQVGASVGWVATPFMSLYGNCDSVPIVAPLPTLLPSVEELQPDYTIRNIRSRFTDDLQQVIVEFEIWNIGGAATVSATAELQVIATGQEIVSNAIQPLVSQEIVTMSLIFPTSIFLPNSVQSLRVAVGVDEVEASSSDTIQNNYAQISITIPSSDTGNSPCATTTPIIRFC